MPASILTKPHYQNKTDAACMSVCAINILDHSMLFLLDIDLDFRVATFSTCHVQPLLSAEAVMATASRSGLCACGACCQSTSNPLQPALPAPVVPPIPFGPLLPPSPLPSLTGQQSSLLARYSLIQVSPCWQAAAWSGSPGIVERIQGKERTMLLRMMLEKLIFDASSPLNGNVNHSMLA